ncbi:unnamed protein product (macronuclear) [Paramecium tetraurelia]|uniref:Pyruvate kinase n=1 Tax=Paramecium tetraurelia TaxID=5888 RepID=A0DYK0_PARTE|nr:uncharacterized protein GSPATT00003085001 [Paramecium tetraurelia]CAK88117.1 unnamed protein product [Paramecium tetraurelia]|eukprot:XP_001455514.1 hypothetical protein (macronuclear) [Paramecium tetraurelia strain d4-2]
MVEAGCNGFTINMAYIKNKESLQILNQNRCQLESEFKTKIPLNLILRGQVIRVGQLQDSETLIEEGNIVYLTSDQHKVGNNQLIPIDSNEFLEKLNINDKLAIDYGHIILELIDIQMFDQVNEKIGIDQICLLSGVKIYICKCCKTGTLKSFKPISIFVENKTSKEEEQLEQVSLTEKDNLDIDYACECNFDSITFSKVNTAFDIIQVSQVLIKEQKYPHVQIFARIAEMLKEDQLEEIVNLADGCIIARSHISMTQPVEDVVKYQAQIISCCRKLFKPVFVSTYILESMSVQLKPSFADMGDISNIVKQYIDGILLSGETSFGKFPVLIVQTLNNICRKIEKKLLQELFDHPQQRDQYQQLPNHVLKWLICIKYSAILMLTRRIQTTLKLSKLRASCKIISISDNQQICRCLNYINNVQSELVNGFANQEEIIQECISRLIAKNLLQPKDYIVVITGMVVQNKDWHINQMKVLEI